MIPEDGSTQEQPFYGFSADIDGGRDPVASGPADQLDGRREPPPPFPRPPALAPFARGRRREQRGIPPQPRGDVGPREIQASYCSIRAIARERELTIWEPGRELPHHRGPQRHVRRPALAVEADI